MTETDEITQWVTKEILNLLNNANRLALLAIIKKYQDEGIYGYLIGEKLIEATSGELDGTKATFYAILRRFEKEKLVENKLKVSQSGPARKHYYLTPKGERAYQALWQNWIHYYGILEDLIESTEKELQ
ncbi:MAG: PadR family transcriptional regulator [Candidatus Hodarchaeales archaeon]